MSKAKVYKQLPKIAQICKVRKGFGFSCRNCDAYGDACTNFCKENNVNYPAEVSAQMEEKQNDH